MQPARSYENSEHPVEDELFWRWMFQFSSLQARWKNLIYRTRSGQTHRRATVEQLAQHMQWTIHLQRGHYLVIAGKSRQQAYPSLAAPRRPCSSDDEATEWNLLILA